MTIAINCCLPSQEEQTNKQTNKQTDGQTDRQKRFHFFALFKTKSLGYFARKSSFLSFKCRPEFHFDDFCPASIYYFSSVVTVFCFSLFFLIFNFFFFTIYYYYFHELCIFLRRQSRNKTKQQKK